MVNQKKAPLNSYPQFSWLDFERKLPCLLLTTRGP
jgi:hypothetical protein